VLSANSQRLVDELQGLTALDGRFVDIALVNMPHGKKRGNFSLVFRAFDKVEQKPVALKFFDLDPAKMDAFRLACFDREHQLLTKLLGAARCLQVLSPISTFEFDIGTNSAPYKVAAKYFITEWYDADIDEFFLRQDPSRAILKLRLFNEVVLAVEALHHRHICHRDIKVDNFRREHDSDISGLVAIDLGTAAALDSTPYLPAYAGPVGLGSYSAPETFCGFAGRRDLAVLTDIYALGGMLFELFAEDDFLSAYVDLNPDFPRHLGILQYQLAGHINSPTLDAVWDNHAPKLLAGFSPLKFPPDASSVPLAILDIVNDLVLQMTSLNFRSRTITLEGVRRRIWSAIRCLENEAVAKLKAEQAAVRRARKRESARAKGAGLFTPTSKMIGGPDGRP